MEASALTHASRLGLLGRRSRLLRLQGDERLIALTREGQERGFEALVERYQARLLAFCRGMLGSSEDAEDVLQEVFVAAHKAILADNRPINARPWLYRIARNRCLNHLRRPVPEGQDSMDVHPHENGATVDDRVQKREEFRALIADVQTLADTQRTALLLREIEALSYEEIAAAMETTVPAVKSLLVRARMSLADCTQGRHLTCDEVHLELAEAAEGLRKASGPARAHLRRCERCREYRATLRRNGRALAALAPLGGLAAVQGVVAAKLGLGGAKAAGSGASAGGAAGLAGGAAAGGVGGAVGAKALAGVASFAILTAGAVEVNRLGDGQPGREAQAAAEPATVAYAGGAVAAERVVVPGGPGHDDADRQREPASGDQGGRVVQAEIQASEPVVAPAPEEGEPAHEPGSSDAVAGGGEAGTGTAGGDSGGVISEPAPTDPGELPTEPTEPGPPVTDPPPEHPPVADPEPLPPADSD